MSEPLEGKFTEDLTGCPDEILAADVAAFNLAKAEGKTEYVSPVRAWLVEHAIASKPMLRPRNKTGKKDPWPWPKRYQLYNALIKRLGVEHQQGVAIGELAELIEQLVKANRGKGVNMRICEEIADVEIVIEQMKLIHDPEGIRVQLFREFKLARLDEYNVKGGEK